MKNEELIEELQSVAGQLGVQVRYEKGDFEGGYCILRDRRLMLVNKKLMPRRRAAVLAVALREIGLENVYLKPAVRAFIEDESVRSARPTP